MTDCNACQSDYHIKHHHRPDTGIVEQKDGWQKKDADQKRIINLESVFFAAENAADKTQYRKDKEQGQR